MSFIFWLFGQPTDGHPTGFYVTTCLLVLTASTITILSLVIAFTASTTSNAITAIMVLFFIANVKIRSSVVCVKTAIV